MIYNWQQQNWPSFHYKLKPLEAELAHFMNHAAKAGGMVHTLPDDVEVDYIIDMLVAEAVKTSAIEGELMSRKDVMSSVRNNLGLNKKAEQVKDKRAAGIGELMVAVRNTYAQPLTEEMLFDWHKMLMKGSKKIEAGKWRSHKEPMQVISGAVGKEKIHFEAPPSNRVPREMKTFIKWFNETAPGGNNETKHAAVRAAIAHLYFESIHPFVDGNGRIGRAIAEKALSQHLGRPILMSISQSIEAHKRDYYGSLQKAQTGKDVTLWILYFVKMLNEAQQQAEQHILFVLNKARFFDKHRNNLNERQLKVVRKMLEQGAEGFEGGMNARKYISITGASKATATRDLQEMAEAGLMKASGGGRSTRYELMLA
jgi:Fic family protein